MHGRFSRPALAFYIPLGLLVLRTGGKGGRQRLKRKGGAAQLEDGTLRCYKKEDTRKADELHGLTRRVEHLHACLCGARPSERAGPRTHLLGCSRWPCGVARLLSLWLRAGL